MSDHKVDFQMDSGVAIEVKNNMRERLVADLRSQARQSSATRQSRVAQSYRPIVRATLNTFSRVETEMASNSMVEGEPQAVLIRNRSEDLEKDIIRLRSRYAKLLSKELDN